jgi:hypothetical protein
MTDRKTSSVQSWGRDYSGLSPLKAIKANCLECSGGSAHEAKNCKLVECPLHSFRTGRKPVKISTNVPDEVRAARVARAKANFGRNTINLPEIDKP